MVESETNNRKHIRKSKLLPKYLEKTKIDEMLEKARNDNKRKLPDSSHVMEDRYPK